MANQDPMGKLTYWYGGTSSTLITSTELALIGRQNYWYNGSTQGFLLGSVFTSNPRNFSVLIGF